MDLRGLDLRVAGDRHRSTFAVPRVVTELRVGLQPTERRQDVREAPAGVAARGPGIEVRGRAADREPSEPRGAPSSRPRRSFWSGPRRPARTRTPSPARSAGATHRANPPGSRGGRRVPPRAGRPTDRPTRRGGSRRRSRPRRLRPPRCRTSGRSPSDPSPSCGSTRRHRATVGVASGRFGTGGDRVDVGKIRCALCPRARWERVDRPAVRRGATAMTTVTRHRDDLTSCGRGRTDRCRRTGAQSTCRRSSTGSSTAGPPSAWRWEWSATGASSSSTDTGWRTSRRTRRSPRTRSSGSPPSPRPSRRSP